MKKKTVENMPEITNAQMDLDIYLSIKKTKSKYATWHFKQSRDDCHSLNVASLI